MKKPMPATGMRTSAAGLAGIFGMCWIYTAVLPIAKGAVLIMTREEGIRMVQKYDHVKPRMDLERWLNYVGMAEGEFDAIISCCKRSGGETGLMANFVSWLIKIGC